MADDLELDVWITRAEWCPNPLSDSQMQRELRARLVKGRVLIVTAGSKPLLVGEIPGKGAELLRPILERRISPDVCFLESEPERRRVLVSVFVDRDDILDTRREQARAASKERAQAEADRREAEKRLAERKARRAAQRAQAADAARRASKAGIRGTIRAARISARGIVAGVRAYWRWILNQTSS